MPLRTLALALVALLLSATHLPAQQRPLRIYIAVDIEGTSGVGTSQMIGGTGKDYGSARRFATEEVNAVVGAILQHGPAEFLVNDAHGDMQNLLHADLHPAIVYQQGSQKPFGMMQGLDSTFDAAIFLGFHARSGTPGAFLAHTSSGMTIQNVWIDGIEVGEGELGARIATLRQTPARGPVTLRVRFGMPGNAEALTAIPGMQQVDGQTVEMRFDSMLAAYRLYNLMYRYHP